MARVVAETLPTHSALHSMMQSGDFLDCYAKPCGDDVDAMAVRAMTMPRWVTALMALRNIIVAPLGLKNGAFEGETVGPFPVLMRNKDEIVLGADDSHLDFRISLMVHNGRAYSATWVRTHNWLGRTYLRVIMPFHILIVKNAVGRA